MSMSKYIEAPEEFDGQGQGRMPAVGSGWVGCDLLQALTRSQNSLSQLPLVLSEDSQHPIVE